MYKIKISDSALQSRLEKAGIKNYDIEYQYLLTDNLQFFEENKINILFENKDFEEIVNLVKWLILKEDYVIKVENIRGIKMIKSRDVDYFEAFDNDVYAIVGKERYDVLEKLYVLEEKLNDNGFIRISKSYVVNIQKIEYIRPLLNYKLQLQMHNGDSLEVNRTYVKSFKERIKLR